MLFWLTRDRKRALPLPGGEIRVFMVGVALEFTGWGMSRSELECGSGSGCPGWDWLLCPPPDGD